MAIYGLCPVASYGQTAAVWAARHDLHGLLYLMEIIHASTVALFFCANAIEG